jgi:hypothetical protein
MPDLTDLLRLGCGTDWVLRQQESDDWSADQDFAAVDAVGDVVATSYYAEPIAFLVAAVKEAAEGDKAKATLNARIEDLTDAVKQLRDAVHEAEKKHVETEENTDDAVFNDLLALTDDIVKEVLP